MFLVAFLEVKLNGRLHLHGRRQKMSDELIGSYLACASCGERDIVRDAWLIYDQSQQDWIIHSIFDQYYCQQCEGTDTITKVDEAYRLEIIKDLNQKLRQGEVQHGTVILTKGIEALGAEFQYQLFQAIYDYDDFSKDNDPYGEQDFGSLTLAGQNLLED